MEDIKNYTRKSELPSLSQLFDRICQLRTLDSWSKLQPPIDGFIKDSKQIQKELDEFLTTSSLTDPGEVVLASLRSYQLLIGGLLGLAKALEDKIIGITAINVEASDSKITQAAKDKLGKERAAVIKGLEAALSVMSSNLTGHIITTQQIYRG